MCVCVRACVHVCVCVFERERERDRDRDRDRETDRQTDRQTETERDRDSVNIISSDRNEPRSVFHSTLHFTRLGKRDQLLSEGAITTVYTIHIVKLMHGIFFPRGTNKQTKKV